MTRARPPVARGRDPVLQHVRIAWVLPGRRTVLQTFPPNQNAIARGGGITTPPAHAHLAWSVVTLVAAGVLAVAALSAQDARSIWSRIPVDGEVIVTTRWPIPERCQAAATKT